MWGWGNGNARSLWGSGRGLSDADDLTRFASGVKPAPALP